MRITPKDLEAVAAIQKAGGIVGVYSDGEPFLQTYSQIDRLRFERLIALGLLKPSVDAMFDGAQPQTYHLTEVH